jgi:hypothetical protein
MEGAGIKSKTNKNLGSLPVVDRQFGESHKGRTLILCHLADPPYWIKLQAQQPPTVDPYLLAWSLEVHFPWASNSLLAVFYSLWFFCCTWASVLTEEHLDNSPAEPATWSLCLQTSPSKQESVACSTPHILFILLRT